MAHEAALSLGPGEKTIMLENIFQANPNDPGWRKENPDKEMELWQLLNMEDSWKDFWSINNFIAGGIHPALHGTLTDPATIIKPPGFLMERYFPKLFFQRTKRNRIRKRTRMTMIQISNYSLKNGARSLSG